MINLTTPFLKMKTEDTDNDYLEKNNINNTTEQVNLNIEVGDEVKDIDYEDLVNE